MEPYLDLTLEAAAGSMDPRAELGAFLRSRRARLKPRDVGLPDFGRYRRVPGLRREELSQLAGVSVAYYTRLEQGDARNVSAQVLDSIARALRLTDAERVHLTHLAKPSDAVGERQQVRRSLQTLMDAMDGVPAIVVGRRSDILAWNRLATAVFGDWSHLAATDRNWAKLVFLRPDYRELILDWDQKAFDTVSQLRLDAGSHPRDPLLSALVRELSTRSSDFRRLWAAHTVLTKCSGRQNLQHPVVGALDLSIETLYPADDAEQMLLTYHAEPGSPSADRLQLLASWAPDASEALMVERSATAAH